jgi:hypothetical protein
MSTSVLEHPVFQVGAERSGTTMFRLMLNAHPKIAFASEMEFLVDLLPGRSDWPATEEFAEYLANNRIFNSPGYRYTIDPSLDYPRLAQSFLHQFVERQDREIAVVGATIHHHYTELLRIWPKSRFLHVLRDPRDVARSAIGMGWAGNTYHGVDIWITAERLWDELLAKITPDRWLEVRYERLVADTEAELRRVCAFLGVKFDPDMLRYHENSTYETANPSYAFQWKRKQSEEEIQLVEAKLGPLLEARGYEPSGLPALVVSPEQEARLARENYWAKVKHRVKFLGPALFTAEYITRRLGPQGAQRWVQKRVFDLIDRSVK